MQVSIIKLGKHTLTQQKLSFNEITELEPKARDQFIGFLAEYLEKSDFYLYYCDGWPIGSSIRSVADFETLAEFVGEADHAATNLWRELKGYAEDMQELLSLRVWNAFHNIKG